MRRIVSVWLPRFLTDRLLRAAPATDAQPETLLAVITPGKGGNRLIAVNADAENAGLKPGMLLTDATAIAPELRAQMQDAKEEAVHLRRLALWCRRYSPWVALDGADGLRIDITGAAHLFGGEAALLRDLRARFSRAGFACRAAIAGTPAAAWGMARFGRASLSIIPDGEERRRLAPLPVRALRIEEDKAAVLDQLGLKLIGQLLSMPRPQLRTRFGTSLCARLDQAIGIESEALTSLAYEPVYRERLDLAEPVSTLEGIGIAAELLAQMVSRGLSEDGRAARSFTLTLYDTKGESTDVALALARPSQHAAHITRLFRERFAALEGRFGEDVAFDAVTLLAGRIEYLRPGQSELPGEDAPPPDAAGLGAFLDRLNARLGEGAVRRFAFRESHSPERAATTVPILRKAVTEMSPAPAPRPFLLLPHPEEIVAIAELPDYPPRAFTWRRMQHKVVKAQGPERIAPEWWLGEAGAMPARDYYAVEDNGGRRFWLFREGAYAADSSAPRWYMHGLLP